MNRFPLRTLVLMGLTLLAFLYFWFSTQKRLAARRPFLEIRTVRSVDGGAL